MGELIAPEVIVAAEEAYQKRRRELCGILDPMEAAIRAADKARGLRVEVAHTMGDGQPLAVPLQRYISDWKPVAKARKRRKKAKGKRA